MNLQLKTFLNILNKRGIEYWIDSGTLLGLIREGDVLSDDQDIDIGIHINQLNRIKHKSIKRIYRKLGYKWRVETYNGKIFKFKLYPRDKNNKLLIDINIYQQKNEEFLWCPSTYFVSSKNIFFKKYQRLLKFFWRKISQKIEVNEPPYNKVQKSYTWTIPYEYYKDIKFNNEFYCYMFKDKEKYLSYRYGLWEEKNENWDTFLDDGGLIKEAPEKFIL